MSDDDWSESWRVHPHTAQLRKNAEIDKDQALSTLLSVATSSTDPEVRAAFALYRAATLHHALFVTADPEKALENG